MLIDSLSLEHTYKQIISGRRRGILATAVRFGLWLCSFVYALVVRARNQKFARPGFPQKAEVPVISIGNITTGGTGKTPLVCYVARKLRQLELRVTILSRGYKSNSTGVNDEALELEIRLPDVPHLQDPNRLVSARIACQELDSQVLLLDDGFQHRRIARDVDVVVIDATAPFGFGYCLPRGLLREPLSNLSRADLVVINRCNLVDDATIELIRDKILKHAPESVFAQANTVALNSINSSGEVSSLEDLRKGQGVAFCGIGNPEGFQATLDQNRIRLSAPLRVFPDHHHYSRNDISELDNWIKSHSDIDWVLCTHKDLVKVKLNRLGGRPLKAVLIENQFSSGEEQLWELIEKKILQGASPEALENPGD